MEHEEATNISFLALVSIEKRLRSDTLFRFSTHFFEKEGTVEEQKKKNRYRHRKQQQDLFLPRVYLATPEEKREAIAWYRDHETKIKELAFFFRESLHHLQVRRIRNVSSSKCEPVRLHASQNNWVWKGRHPFYALWHSLYQDISVKVTWGVAQRSEDKTDSLTLKKKDDLPVMIEIQDLHYAPYKTRGKSKVLSSHDTCDDTWTTTRDQIRDQIPQVVFESQHKHESFYAYRVSDQQIEHDLECKRKQEEIKSWLKRVRKCERQIAEGRDLLKPSVSLGWWDDSQSTALCRTYTIDQRATIVSLFLTPKDPFPFVTLVEHLEFVRVHLRDMWQVVQDDPKRYPIVIRNKDKSKQEVRFGQLQFAFNLFLDVVKGVRMCVKKNKTYKDLWKKMESQVAVEEWWAAPYYGHLQDPGTEFKHFTTLLLECKKKWDSRHEYDFKVQSWRQMIDDSKVELMIAIAESERNGKTMMEEFTSLSLHSCLFSDCRSPFLALLQTLIQDSTTSTQGSRPLGIVVTFPTIFSFLSRLRFRKKNTTNDMTPQPRFHFLTHDDSKEFDNLYRRQLYQKEKHEVLDYVTGMNVWKTDSSSFGCLVLLLVDVQFEICRELTLKTMPNHPNHIYPIAPFLVNSYYLDQPCLGRLLLDLVAV